jgi:hypothetical protein
MEINPTADSLIHACDFRELLMAEESRGAYYREQPLAYDSWLNGTDMRQLGGLYNIAAAFDSSNNHWKLILGAEYAGNDNVRVLEYDPLIGVNERLVDIGSFGQAELTPELSRQYYRESDDSIQIQNSDGSWSGLPISEFLMDYYQRNPTSQRAISYLRNMGGTQYDADNCGPLAFQAALIAKWASEGRLPSYRINSINSEDDDIVIEGRYDTTYLGNRSDITYHDDDIHIEDGFDRYDSAMEFLDSEIVIGEPVDLDIIEIGEPYSIFGGGNSNLYWKFRNGLSQIKNYLSSVPQYYLNNTSDDIVIMEWDSDSGSLITYGY